ncbi:MAG: hypothetical protein N4A35_15250 [Flavobacteriales bacterium]|jgi:hypothetical protein|nr:hypothetical protein [Flavobacteriales bacterium]
MELFIERVRNIIDTCWESFSAKVGGGLISVNKEASMQLQFAYLLKNTMELTLHHSDEQVRIELETGVPVAGRMRECDIVLEIEKGDEKCFLPIEMKYYREFASSGGKRGASDIFMKDVHVDIELIESYQMNPFFISGIVLVMTDLKRLVYPTSKTGKKWDYDISNGTSIKGVQQFDTPIGGKPVDIVISGNYDFEWNQVGGHYFLILENIEI